MVPLKEHFKEYDESGAVHTLVNAFGFFDPRTLLTKSGDLVAMLRLLGPDAESQDAEQLAALAARLKEALRAFPEDYIVTSYWTKRCNPWIEVEAHADLLINNTVRNRRDYLMKHRRLSESETHLAITRKSQWRLPTFGAKVAHFLKRPAAAIRGSLSTRARIAALREPLEHATVALHRVTNNFIEQIKGDFHVEVLDRNAVFGFLRRQLNPDRAKADAIRLKHDCHVGFFAADSGLACYPDHLRLGDSFIKILTLKEPPAHTFVHLLRDLCFIHTDMTVVAEWHPCDMADATRKIRSMRRHFHNTKVGLWSQIGSERPHEREMIFDDSKEALVADLGHCLEAVEMEGLQIGEFSLTILVFGSSREAVERATAEVRRVIGVHEGMINEEDYNLLNAFCTSLPGGHPFNLRKLLISNKNHVDLSPWFVPSEGERRDAYLNAPSLIVFETEERSLFHFSLHVGDVGHALVVGSTGTGKSFLLNAVVANAQKYGPYIFILEFGGSYRFLTEALHGSCISLRPEALDFKINPFALPLTPANIQFQVAFTKLLIESSGYRMSDAEEKDLFGAIEGLALLDPPQRRLRTVTMTVGRSLSAHLTPWVEGEPHGGWFDHAEDTVSYARFQYIDMEGMDRIGPPLEPLLFYLFQRFNEVISSPGLATVFKLAVVDEAWRFFTHPVTRSYIETALRTWRKKNAAMLLSTQSLHDLPGADLLRPIVDNCPTKILLANPTLDASFYADVLQLTATEQEKIRNLVPKRQFLLKREGLSKILNFNVDPWSYWLFTTNPFEAKRRDQLVAEIGLETALNILAGGSQ